MNKAYKFRLYPNEKQKEYFAKTFGCARFIYNRMLADKIKYYEETQKILHNTPAQYKKEFEWLKEVDSLALANAQLNLQNAYKNFFVKQNKFPKYKSKRNKQSYTTNNQNGNIHFTEDNKYIILPKIKGVKIVKHRDIKGIIKSVTISKNCANQYFISILTECEEPQKLSNNKNIVGIDLGIKEFAVISNGEKIENPKFLKKSLDKLKKEQRKLSKCVNGSNNRSKQRIKVARIYNKITNQRNDFLHKLSTRLINENQVICLETLNIKNMIKNHCLAQSISDVSWSKFVDLLIYKSEWYGRSIIQIPQNYASSQTCSVCGYVNKEIKDLSIREWSCPNCNTHHDRDINASINILHKGLEILGQELPVEPVYAYDNSHIEQEAFTFRQR